MPGLCRPCAGRRDRAGIVAGENMSRTPARITQADLARAIRAAQQCGAGPVRVLPDGTITIDPQPNYAMESKKEPVEADEDIVL